MDLTKICRPRKLLKFDRFLLVRFFAVWILSLVRNSPSTLSILYPVPGLRLLDGFPFCLGGSLCLLSGTVGEPQSVRCWSFPLGVRLNCSPNSRSPSRFGRWSFKARCARCKSGGGRKTGRGAAGAGVAGESTVCCCCWRLCVASEASRPAIKAESSKSSSPKR
jgi:hypothetical protein